MSSEWPITSIADIASSIPGSLAVGPFGSRMKADLYVPSGVRVIRGNNLSGGREPEGDYVHVSEQTADSLASCCLKSGDLVFPHRGNIGQVGITPDDGRRYMLSTSLMKLSPDRKKADPLYLMYFFKSTTGRAALLMNASQVGTPGIATPLKSLRGIQLPLPPLSIQREISATLSTLDDRITLLRETNATLEAIAQALFKSWFVDFDAVRAKQEGRPPEGMDEATAALFPDSFEESELGLVPKGWEACPIYDLATYINGAAYKAFEPNSERRGLPIIKIAELKSGVTSQTAYSEIAMPEKYRIETGDILFSWSGNPDTSIDTFVWHHDQAWLNQHIFRVIPHAPEERSFVLQMLRHLRPVFAELARNKQTTGLGHVTVADMKRMLVIRPDKTTLDCFNQMVGPIQKRIFENEIQAQTLATLRDTLLPRLISGQLRLSKSEEFA
jgi:type I restriction enzyme, S subunit